MPTATLHFLRSQHPLCLSSVPPHSDVSRNSLYGAIYRNFIGTSPTTGIINLAYNYFYGLPSLSASGQQYCPDDIPSNGTQSIAGSLPFSKSVNFPNYSAGEASLEDNCLTILPVGCTAQQAQRSADQCAAFCNTVPADSLSSLSSSASSSSSSSSSSPLAPCDGHGTCLPSWAFPPASLPPNAPPFMCNCSDGYYSMIVNGASTCTLTAPGREGTAVEGAFLSWCLSSLLVHIVL